MGTAVAQVSSVGEPTWLIPDFAGTTIATARTAGATAVGKFDAFGNLTSGTMAQPLQFQGQYKDSVLGLYDMRARDYNSVTGQFTASDPLAVPTGHAYYAGYSYGLNNPLVSSDASGMRPACASGGARDQDACYYGTVGVELNPYLPDVFGGGVNREYDRGMNGPKRPHKIVKSSGDSLFLPKLVVNCLGGVLNGGISAANGAIWLGSTVTSGPPPRIPSVPVWDGDSPHAGRFYYWASYTGSAGLAIFGPKSLKLPARSAEAADTGGSGLLRLTTEESWGNPATLERHFIDHGADFGAATADGYAAQASQFFQDGIQSRLPTRITPDGVIRVYDPATNTSVPTTPTGPREPSSNHPVPPTGTANPVLPLRVDMNYTCPVCGYPDLTELPRPEYGGGSYEICPSCGFQFGVTDDDLGVSFEEWRARWIEGGMLWRFREIEDPPNGWDPVEQLGRLDGE